MPTEEPTLNNPMPSVARLTLHPLAWDGQTLYGRGAVRFEPAVHARLAHGITRELPMLGRALAARFFTVFEDEFSRGLASRLVLLAAPDASGGLPATLLVEAFQQGLNEVLASHQYDMALVLAAQYPGLASSPAYEQLGAGDRQRHWHTVALATEDALADQVVVVVDYARMSGAKEAFLLGQLAALQPEAIVFCTLAAAPKSAVAEVAAVSHAYRRWGAHDPASLLKLLGNDPVRPTAWLTHRIAREFIGSEWQQLVKSAPPQLLTGLAQYLQSAPQPLPPAERNLQLVVTAALQQRRTAPATTRKPPRRAK